MEMWVIKMGILSKNSSGESELELAIGSIPWNKDLEFKYDGGGEVKSTPVYILPVEFKKNFVYASFYVNGQFKEAPLGFKHTKNFLSTSFYHLNGLGSPEKVDYSDKVLYLPLALTNFKSQIGLKVDGKFKPNEGSPYTILGLKGNSEYYPLVLLSQTEDGMKIKGLYCTEKEVKTYFHSETYSPKLVEEFLVKLRGNETDRKSIKTSQKTFSNPESIAGEREPVEDSNINLEDATELVKYLGRFVVGQNEAKKIIAVAFSNYITRMKTGDEDLPKDNLLLIGPPGVGKSYSMSLLAKLAGIPMFSTKVTGKSTTGYKDESLSTVLERVRHNTEGEAPYAIVFFDEIDKTAKDYWGSGSGFGTRLQDEMIGWFEEATLMFDGINSGDPKQVLNTKNILFVAAGAFQGEDDSGLESIVEDRLGLGKKRAGFRAADAFEENEEGILKKVRPQDLITYGLKPELVRRLPYLAVLDRLTDEDKVEIITKAKNSVLDGYRKLLKHKGYDVEVEESFPSAIVAHCPEETGASSLNSVCSDFFTEVLYEPKKFAEDALIKLTPALVDKLVRFAK